MFAPFGDEGAWRGVYQGMVEIRNRVQSQARKRVRIHPRCAPGMAILAGSVFHRASGVEVEVDQNGVLWDLNQGRSAALRGEGRDGILAAWEQDWKFDEGEGLQERHLLISVAANVLPGYQTWRLRNWDRPDLEKVAARIALSLAPLPAQVTGARAACRLALEADRLIRELPEPQTPLRIFFAGPVGLAVALGRELNTAGQVILMDWDKDSQQYQESITLTA